MKNYNFEQVNKKIKIENEKVDLKKIWIFAQNNITFLDDVKNWSKIITSTIDLEKHNIPVSLIETAIESIPEEPFTYETWDIWTKSINQKTGLKGKDLFMPLRLILTGRDKGPELKNFLPLLDKQTLLRKFGKT